MASLILGPSLIAQLVKNPLAMQETPVQFLGQEDPVEEEMATHSSILRLPWGFPDSSTGKESTCNARDPSSVPKSRRSPGEGIGYPLQYSWVSLVAQW